MRPITTIILHCSDSLWGNVESIDGWHRERGWSGIGYHFVIGNGYPEHANLKERKPFPWLDGFIETGRPIDQAGAHVYGYNSDTIGVCMIGKDTFTQRQLRSVVSLFESFWKDYPYIKLLGHYELDDKTTCPNLDMNLMRKIIVVPAMLDHDPKRGEFTGYPSRTLREG